MALGMFLLVAVAFWMFILIILPQLFMVDFSLSKNLPPADVGGPLDVVTLEHYKFMIYGSARESGGYNTVDLSVFVRTLLAALFVTLFDLALCYPIAYYLAQSAHGGWGRLMVLSLIVPFWVNEILRAFSPSASCSARPASSTPSSCGRESSMSPTTSSRTILPSMRGSAMPTSC